MTGMDLRIIRIQNGIKQFELAAWLGIPQTTLSRIELGQVPLSPEIMVRVSDFFAHKDDQEH
jgi:transcriptional regulator with XRE-family HTH domain